MHPQFAEWYRPLMLQADDKFLKSRWELVEKTAKDLSARMALDLVRLSFGLPVQDDAAIATLKQQLKSESLSYVRATAHLELSLIGDCVLLEALKQSSQKLLRSHVLLASALCCQQGIRKTLSRSVPKELFVASRALLDRLSVQWRRTARISAKPETRSPFPSAQTAPRVSPEQIIIAGYDNYRNIQQQQITIPNLAEINQGFQQLLARQQAGISWVEDAFKTLADSSLQHQKAVATAMDSPREENDVQWYLFGETSRDLHRPFASFKIAELVPIAASELAELTRVLPGMYACACLSGSGSDADTSTRRSSVHGQRGGNRSRRAAAVAYEEPISLSGFDGVQDLTPVLCALSYATAGKDDWLTMVPELCRVPVETELPARELAYQLYQEILFSRLAQGTACEQGSQVAMAVTISCKQSGCPVATTGACMEGVKPAHKLPERYSLHPCGDDGCRQGSSPHQARQSKPPSLRSSLPVRLPFHRAKSYPSSRPPSCGEPWAELWWRWLATRMSERPR
jgi:hypothetical protein